MTRELGRGKIGESVNPTADHLSYALLILRHCYFILLTSPLYD